MFSKSSFPEVIKTQDCVLKSYLFTKQQILYSSKQTEFADDNFKFDENGGKFSERLEKCCWKRRNSLFQAISPFPTEFS